MKESATISSARGFAERAEALAESAVPKRGLWLAIVTGGLTAGVIDITSAFMTFGRNVPKGIASGLLGSEAFAGGPATWALGLGLHFFILLCAAALYCISSIRLGFLKVNFLVCGVFYGIAVYLVMNLIVLPLSAYPRPVGPFTSAALFESLGAMAVATTSAGVAWALGYRDGRKLAINEVTAAAARMIRVLKVPLS